MRFLAALSLLASVLGPGPVVPVVHTVTGAVEAPRADLVEALAVLHAWDGRRARAWASVDSAALRSLYVPGSGAGRADLRLLRSYAARGIVVRRIVTQVFAVRVVRSDASAMRLRVFDRVAGGEVARGGRVVALSSSEPVTRVIELRPGPTGWQVVSVSGSGRGPRAAQR
jgi:hypothetical protein